MTLTTTLLVLLAALLHATWNAFVRANADRLSMVGYISLGSAIAVLPFVPFVPLPTREVWPILALSIALHTGYKLFLARAYEHGALGHVYPIARGTAPLVVTLAGLLFLGEKLPPFALVGVLLITGGIMSLAAQRNGTQKATPEAIIYSLITSLFIAAYTINDGLGGRAAVTALSYTVWLFVLDGLAFMAVIAWRRNFLAFIRPTRTSLLGIGGGIIGALGYGIVIWAMSANPLGPVAALRETSVIFAALISAFVMKERFGVMGILAAITVAVGVMLLRF